MTDQDISDENEEVRRYRCYVEYVQGKWATNTESIRLSVYIQGPSTARVIAVIYWGGGATTSEKNHSLKKRE
jgi:hypothetical protein